MIESVFGQIWKILTSWGESLLMAVPDIVAALLILLLFYLLARLLRALTGQLATRATDNAHFVSLLRRIVFVIAVLLGVMLAVQALNLQRALTSILASVGIAGLVLGFAFRDIAANVMAGVILTLRGPFQKGDLIESNDFFGTIETINLRFTQLRTLTGQNVYIPNQQVLHNPIQNFSQSGKRRIDLAVGVSYGDDLEKVQEVTLASVRELAGRDAERDAELFFVEFDSSSIVFQLRIWIAATNQVDYLDVRSQAIKQIHDAYAAHEITIPFPIRTLDFGIVGGEKLSAMLPRSATD